MGQNTYMSKKDYYESLGVARQASADEIKKAYRKLARKYHPDTAGESEENVRKFHEIQEAYDVLSDAEKRKNYDRFGHAAQNMGGFGQQPGGGFGGFNFSDIFSGFGGAGRSGGFGGMEDIFDQLRGGHASRGHRRPRQEVKGQNISHSITIPFIDAAMGTSRDISLTITDPNGSRRTEKIMVKIPAGIENGGKVRLRGKGQPSSHGPSGDLILTVNVGEHKLYKREGYDIYMDLPVTVAEAVFGAQVEVPTLAGQKTVVRVPAGSPSGRKLRLREKGIKSASSQGDMYLVVKIVPPADIDDQSAELLREFSERNAQDNIRDW